MNESTANKMGAILKGLEGKKLAAEVELETGRIVQGEIAKVDDVQVTLVHGASHAERKTIFPAVCIVSITLPK